MFFFQIYAIFLLNENFSICLILCKQECGMGPHPYHPLSTPLRSEIKKKKKVVLFHYYFKKNSHLGAQPNFTRTHLLAKSN